MRVLALDVGDVRTGVALSDTARMNASPLAVLSTRELCANNAALLRLLDEYEVGCVVVGFPFEADGSHGSQARHVQATAGKLLAGLDALRPEMRVVFADERFSSIRARERGQALGLNERDMRGQLDSRAAAQFLQDYLDRPDRRRETDEADKTNEEKQDV